MKKITHNFDQGSKEWHEHRAKHFNASEVAAMMGMSPYMSRSELLKSKALCIDAEFDESTQRLFMLGHQYEAIARPWAEALLGEELYPATLSIDLDGLPLSASYDGLNMDESMVWEHKTLNDVYRNALSSEDLPMHVIVQMEQQMFIAGCVNCLFTASNGIEADAVHINYRSDKKIIDQIIAGWKQFSIDLEQYKHVELIESPRPMAIEALPTLSIDLVGEVKQTNIVAYKATVLAYIENINTDLVTDQDFANAENAVKSFEEAEKEIELVKKQALSQTASIDELFRTVETLKEAMRSKRLTLNKLVTARKETIRSEIAANAVKCFHEHVQSLNESLGEVLMPVIKFDMHTPMKGKKLISSLHDAVNTELARLKIEASRIAETIRTNIRIIEEKAPNHKFLFMDRKELVMKDPNDLINLIEARLSKHKEAEDKRLEIEREKIRKEEVEKLEKANQIEVATTASVTSISPYSNVVTMAPATTPAHAPLDSDYVALVEDKELLLAFIIENIMTIASLLKSHAMTKKIPGVKFVLKSKEA